MAQEQVLTVHEQLEQQGRRAKEAARVLATLSTEVKDRALEAMAAALEERAADILEANRSDVENARARGVSSALLDRLTLNERRLADMAEGLRAIVRLPDPIGRGIAHWRLPNGLEIQQVRVPLGVVGMIYEGRPNVTVDAAGLCLKSGNAVLLRGSRDALASNRAITEVIAAAATGAGVPEGAIQLVEAVDRESALAMMRLNRYLDVLIPRGGAGLIRTVVEHATVPVIETGVGNCHTYVDQFADLDQALAIAVNAKCQRPGVCNAMETLLVHSAVAGEFLPRLAERLAAAGVEMRGCERTRQILPEAVPATEADWETEYLDKILAIRVVDSLDEAIDHIDMYGTRHSEAIVTRDYGRARRFLQRVDAATVYVNASTRFTDGFQFGFGAEIGISTQKLHARGPMGLDALTSSKYIVYGDGHVRT